MRRLLELVILSFLASGQEWPGGWFGALRRGLVCLVVCLAVAGVIGATVPEPTPRQEKVAAEPQEADVTGYYHVEGLDARQSGYEGLVTIRKGNEVYLVNWSVGTTNATGCGLRHGDLFVIGWQARNGPNTADAVSVFKINPDRSMDGTWATSEGSPHRCLEKLTYIRPIKKRAP